MEGQDKIKEPIFQKQVPKRDFNGRLTGETSVVVRPWEMVMANGQLRKGTTMRISVTKMPFGNIEGKQSAVTLDPSDDEIRRLIVDAYGEFDRKVEESK